MITQKCTSSATILPPALITWGSSEWFGMLVVKDEISVPRLGIPNKCGKRRKREGEGERNVAMVKAEFNDSNLSHFFICIVCASP